MNYDVIICGSGIAGIYTALNISSDLKVAIITNDKLESCNTYLAQGGITTVRGKEDSESFIEDTLYAGGNENNLETVKLIAEEADKNIKKLVSMGVPFNRDDNGNLLYTREAAHSKRRILYSNDQTGKHIFLTLAEKMRRRRNITTYSEVEILDLLISNQKAVGVIGINKKNEILEFLGNKVVLATGGIGGLFKNSTNRRNLKGIGIALSKKHGVEISNIGAIQFHPTAFYDPQSERRFLISESLRGEGAELRDLEGNRFVDELLPRDVVAASIEAKKKETDSPYVYLDATKLKGDFLKVRFKGIYQNLLEKGYDLAKDMIPVTTSQHYFMGGVTVDMDGKTSLDGLYACGEIAFTGLHGRNRLASNSLLEGLVFGNRVADHINKTIIKDRAFKEKLPCGEAKLKIENCKDIEKIKEENKKLVIDEILKVREDLKDELSVNR
ncbi:L-aspartate oxidase [Psychrilyobacter atlanticus]|uniref:L-aspartate oxidase n=1 Tax=Psychrilyobacter atlanticus TaxID=271091 RepID=UPI000403AA41|nr:L-aspartate oxidase [Psychrilyobacter atlanticus]